MTEAYNPEFFMPRLEWWGRAEGRAARDMAHPDQRKLTDTEVAIYRVAMLSGYWRPHVGAPFLITETGHLGNGNHRAEAIASLPEDITVPVHVVRDVPESDLPMVDSGRARNLADHLHYFGFATYRGEIAALVKALMVYEGPPRLPVTSPKVNPVEAVEFAIAHRERLVRVASFTKHITGLQNRHLDLRIASDLSLGWLLYFTIDHPDAEEFWEGYATTTASISEADPRMQAKTFYRRRQQAHTPIDDFPRGGTSQPLQRKKMATLSAMWDAHLRTAPWRPWDGKTATFIHPAPDHPVAWAA